MDQTIEVTVNKDTQTAGGTTKFSLNQSAVKRYYITAEHRSGFLRKLRDMTGSDKSDVSHGELRKPRIMKDEQAVESVVTLFESWVNPFSAPQQLVSVSTARAAPAEVGKDLMRAHDVGEAAYAAFKAQKVRNKHQTFP